eukprot:5420107-Pleurochrysis_carterae.AAC.1
MLCVDPKKRAGSEGAPPIRSFAFFAEVRVRRQSAHTAHARHAPRLRRARSLRTAQHVCAARASSVCRWLNGASRAPRAPCLTPHAFRFLVRG